MIWFQIGRSTIAFLLLMGVSRMLGRKLLSHMTFFDFAVAITLGSLTAGIAEGRAETFKSGIISMLTFCALGLLSGLASIVSFRMRKVVASEPLLLINNGEIVKKNMRRERMTLNDLTSLLREKNFFNIADVNYAILEGNGKLSVLPKAEKRPVTPLDMQLQVKQSGICHELIMDGTIMTENLRKSGITEAQLVEMLKQQGLNGADEVFFASLDSTGSLYVSRGFATATATAAAPVK